MSKAANTNGADLRGAGDAVSARSATGLSQASFANHFGIPVGTIRDWEQGRSCPDRTARSFLKVIAAQPKIVQRALEAGSQTASLDRRKPKHGLLDFYVKQWSAERDEAGLADFQFRVMIHLIYQTIESEFRQLCRSKFHFSEGEMRILFTLRRSRAPIRQATFAKHIPITAGAITKQIQRLENRRFVRRIRSNAGTLVELTKQGNQIVNEAFAEPFGGFHISSPAFRSLTETDRAGGLRFLREVLAAILSMRASRKEVAKGQAPGSPPARRRAGK